MAKIPSLGIFTYCYVSAWFNCPWACAPVFGPPPMPSRGLTNNSDLGGKWTATPSPVSLGTDEMTTYQPWGTRAAPLSGVQAVNEAAASRRSTFFVGAVLECPNSWFSNQKSHSSLLSSSSSIYGEPSLRKFSRFTIVFTSSAVAMAAHAPRYSLDLTSSPPLIVPIWNKNGPTSFHGLARLSVSF